MHQNQTSLNIPHWWLAFVRNCVHAEGTAWERAHYHQQQQLSMYTNPISDLLASPPSPQTLQQLSMYTNPISDLLASPPSPQTLLLSQQKWGPLIITSTEKPNCVCATWLLHINIQMRRRMWVSGWVAEWPGFWGQWQLWMAMSTMFSSGSFFFFFLGMGEHSLCSCIYLGRCREPN